MEETGGSEEGTVRKSHTWIDPFELKLQEERGEAACTPQSSRHLLLHVAGSCTSPYCSFYLWHSFCRQGCSKFNASVCCVEL